MKDNDDIDKTGLLRIKAPSAEKSKPPVKLVVLIF